MERNTVDHQAGSRGPGPDRGHSEPFRARGPQGGRREADAIGQAAGGVLLRRAPGAAVLQRPDGLHVHGSHLRVRPRGGRSHRPEPGDHWAPRTRQSGSGNDSQGLGHERGGQRGARVRCPGGLPPRRSLSFSTPTRSSRRGRRNSASASRRTDLLAAGKAATVGAGSDRPCSGHSHGAGFHFHYRSRDAAVTPASGSRDARRAVEGLSDAELSAWLDARGLPAYRSDQIRRWLFRKRATSFEDMTDLSRDLRQALAREFVVGSLVVQQRHASRDGSV